MSKPDPAASPDSADSLKYFETLDEAECLSLLRTNQVGRVGWTGAQGPTILPVAYRQHDEPGVGHQIIFRTAATSVLADLGRADGVRVAFQVDDFDDRTRTGWSVLVRGRCARPASDDATRRLWQSAGPEPWATGERALFLVIEVEQASGRVLAG